MLNIRKILFPTDFSNLASESIAYALYLAGRYKAELHMLHVIVLHTEDPYNPAHHFPDPEALREKLKKQAKSSMISAMADEVSDDVVIKQEQIHSTSAPSTIVDYADEHEIDLIVMSTHGRRGIRQLVLGSVTAEVIRMAPCSVLTLRRKTNGKIPERSNRILVPVDFSDHSREALRVAQYIAVHNNATLQLIHVLENVLHPAFYNMGASSITDLQPDIIDRGIKALKAFNTDAEARGLETEYKVFEGHAGGDIAKFADVYETDLIVISTHGLSDLEHLLIGSVSEKVVRRAPCPVLILKSFKKSLLP